MGEPTLDTAGCVCETDYTRCPHHPVQPWIPRRSRTPGDWERMYLTAEARRRGAERALVSARRDALLDAADDVELRHDGPAINFRAWAAWLRARALETGHDTRAEQS